MSKKTNALTVLRVLLGEGHADYESREKAIAAVAELIGDVAAARRERDEAREAQEYAELELAYLANEMVFNGNSIGWIASKADKYKAALGRAWDALTATGGKCDGNTELADAIRQRGAAVAELIEAAPNLSDYLDGYVMWQRKQGRDPVGLEIAENDIARFRAALARVGGAS